MDEATKQVIDDFETVTNALKKNEEKTGACLDDLGFVQGLLANIQKERDRKLARESLEAAYKG